MSASEQFIDLFQRNLGLAIEATKKGVYLFHSYAQDSKTGLWNAGLLDDRGLNKIKEARRENQWVTIIFFDIRQFKRFNEEILGHLRTDEVLKIGGSVIKGSLRPSDDAIRFGGDEFVLILKGKTRTNASLVIRRLEQRWTEAVRKARLPVNISLSYGTAFIPPSAKGSAAQLWETAKKKAGEGMEESKRSYKAAALLRQAS